MLEILTLHLAIVLMEVNCQRTDDVIVQLKLISFNSTNGVGPVGHSFESEAAQHQLDDNRIARLSCQGKTASTRLDFLTRTLNPMSLTTYMVNKTVPIQIDVLKPGYETELTREFRIEMNAEQSNWTHHSISTAGGSMDFALRVQCQQYKYGKQCTIYCKSTTSHECSPDGDLICKSGWGGIACTDAICDGGCPGGERGSCLGPNQCGCKSGWHGDNCERCVPSSSCGHGFCLTPYGCICYPGWSGINCNIEDNVTIINQYRKSNKCNCKNGGICEPVYNTSSTNQTHHCLCPAAFQGLLCERAKLKTALHDMCKDDSHCKNGGICLHDSHIQVCYCTQDWTGERCEEPIDPCLNQPCRNNGTCVKSTNPLWGSYECRCPPMVHGQNCELLRPALFLNVTSPIEKIDRKAITSLKLLTSSIIVLSLSAIILISIIAFVKIRRKRRRNLGCVDSGDETASDDPNHQNTLPTYEECQILLPMTLLHNETHSPKYTDRPTPKRQG